MKFTPRIAAIGVGLLLIVACTPTSATPSATSSTTVSAPSGSTTPTTAPTDLTQPGAARAVIQQLIAAAGSDEVLMVSVRTDEASISVLVGDQTATWAYRNGQITEVRSDLEYVGQARFDPDSFDLSDVGALFRAAAAVSGSDSEQELQIVDLHRVEHSAADVTMSVSTNPESRTVFFYADGSLVRTLDFNTAEGITTGLTEVIGTKAAVTSVTVSSSAGASISYPATDGTTVIRTRSAKLPVTDLPRTTRDSRTQFDPQQVRAATIWAVLQRSAARDEFDLTTTWSVTAEVPNSATAPRLTFTVGSTTEVTDIAGNPITP